MLSRIYFQPKITGIYYVRIADGAPGAYSIRVLGADDLTSQWDANYEPNNTFWTPYPLALGWQNAITSANPPLGQYASSRNSDCDVFRVSAQLGRWYAAEMFDETSSASLGVYDKDGKEVGSDLVWPSSYSGTASANVTRAVAWPAVYDGVYLVEVCTGWGEQYSVRVLPRYGEGVTWDAAGEPNNTWVSALPLKLGQSIVSTVDEPRPYQQGDDLDLYAVAGIAGQEIQIDANELVPPWYCQLELLGPDGKTVVASDESFSTTPKKIRYTFPSSDTYYVSIHPHVFYYSGSSPNHHVSGAIEYPSHPFLRR